jgi:hypothetical protein
MGALNEIKEIHDLDLVLKRAAEMVLGDLKNVKMPNDGLVRGLWEYFKVNMAVDKRRCDTVDQLRSGMQTEAESIELGSLSIPKLPIMLRLKGNDRLKEIKERFCALCPQLLNEPEYAGVRFS